jgi:hypothetical protein
MILAASAAFADQVTLKNGDRLTGKIQSKDKDALTMKTDMAGEVTIKWENITSVSSDNPLHVVLPDGKTVVGKLETRGDTVSVSTPTASQDVPLAGVQGIRDDAAQKSYERFLKPHITDLWAGYADFGVALARGNAKTTTLTTAFNAARVTKSDKVSVYFNEIYSTAVVNRISSSTANAVRGGWAYNRNLRPRLFLNVFNDYEYDAFQNLDLRFVLGGGAGYSAIKSERAHLDLLGGIAYNREKFGTPIQPAISGASPVFNRNSAEVFWGDDFSYKLTGVTSLTQGFRMFNNLSDTGQYRVNFDLGFATKIRKWISWQITASDRYLTNPAQGRKTNDMLLSTGIRATFAK